MVVGAIGVVGGSDGGMGGEALTGGVASACVATTGAAVSFGVGASFGGEPTSTPSAVRPPQHSTNVEATPTAASRCAFDNRAHT
jgi:hypothetical protein